MTGPNRIDSDHIDSTRIESDKFEAGKFEVERVEVDRIEDHYRQQLSALMDGALSPDQARFLLRRLQHDAELGQCLERWHMAGDALRGEVQMIVCAGFAERVAAMIASEPALDATASPVRAGRWSNGLRWGSGAALAASVALVALLVARPSSGPDPAQAPASVAVEIAAPTHSPSAAENQASETAPTVAVMSNETASLPRRLTNSRNTRSQDQRAAVRVAARSTEQPMVAAALPQGQSPSTSNDAFGNTAIPPSRPWPSAVLPQSATGNFMVDYGRVSSPSFYPFEPRLPGGQGSNDETRTTSDGGPP